MITNQTFEIQVVSVTSTAFLLTNRRHWIPTLPSISHHTQATQETPPSAPVAVSTTETDVDTQMFLPTVTTLPFTTQDPMVSAVVLLLPLQFSPPL